MSDIKLHAELLKKVEEEIHASFLLSAAEKTVWLKEIPLLPYLALEKFYEILLLRDGQAHEALMAALAVDVDQKYLTELKKSVAVARQKGFQIEEKSNSQDEKQHADDILNQLN